MYSFVRALSSFTFQFRFSVSFFLFFRFFFCVVFSLFWPTYYFINASVVCYSCAHSIRFGSTLEIVCLKNRDHRLMLQCGSNDSHASTILFEPQNYSFDSILLSWLRLMSCHITHSQRNYLWEVVTIHFHLATRSEPLLVIFPNTHTRHTHVQTHVLRLRIFHLWTIIHAQCAAIHSVFRNWKIYRPETHLFPSFSAQRK